MGGRPMSVKKPTRNVASAASHRGPAKPGSSIAAPPENIPATSAGVRPTERVGDVPAEEPGGARPRAVQGDDLPGHGWSDVARGREVDGEERDDEPADPVQEGTRPQVPEGPRQAAERRAQGA